MQTITHRSFSYKTTKCNTVVSNEYWEMNDLEKNVNSMWKIFGKEQKSVIYDSQRTQMLQK